MTDLTWDDVRLAARKSVGLASVVALVNGGQLTRLEALIRGILWFNDEHAKLLEEKNQNWM